MNIEDMRSRVLGKDGALPTLMKAAKYMPTQQRTEMLKAVMDLKTAFCNGIKAIK